MQPGLHFQFVRSLLNILRAKLRLFELPGAKADDAGEALNKNIERVSISALDYVSQHTSTPLSFAKKVSMKTMPK